MWYAQCNEWAERVQCVINPVKFFNFWFCRCFLFFRFPVFYAFDFRFFMPFSMCHKCRNGKTFCALTYRFFSWFFSLFSFFHFHPSTFFSFFIFSDFTIAALSSPLLFYFSSLLFYFLSQFITTLFFIFSYHFEFPYSIP